MITYNSIQHILVGWGRSLGIIKTPIDIKDLSDKRVLICKQCKEAKISQVLVLLQKTDILYCTKCSCPCLEKSLVLEENCPLKKW